MIDPVFTDDDIKIIKADLLLNTEIPPDIGIRLKSKKAVALLHRLECAERFMNHQSIEIIHEDGFKLFEEWKKSCGRPS